MLTALLSVALKDAGNAWWQRIRSCDEPVTIDVDALDEASHVGEVLTGVLQKPQPGNPAGRRFRFPFGVRWPAGAGQPPATGAATAKQQPLAHLAEDFLTPAERIRVDAAPWWNRGDVVGLLLVPAESRHLAGSSAGAKIIGEMLADAAGTSYLLARIAAAAATQRAEVIDPCDPGLRMAIDDGRLAVSRDDPHKTLSNNDNREHAAHLLRAVALTSGRGLTLKTIWPLAADYPARYPSDGEPGYGDYDIQEDDITFWLLFHDDLCATLREQRLDLLEEPTT